MPTAKFFRSFVLFLFLAGSPSAAVAQSTVNLILDDPSMDEEFLGTGKFTVTRDGSTAEAINVFVQMTGNAQYSADFSHQNLNGYAHPAWFVTIPAGENSITVTLTAIKDFVIEGDETVIFTLLPPVAGYGDYTIGGQTTVLITILDLVNDIFRDGFEGPSP